MALKNAFLRKQQSPTNSSTMTATNNDASRLEGSWDPALPLAQPHQHFDSEKQATNGGPRKMNRIDKPKIASGDGTSVHDSDTDSSVTVGKQMEMEAGNAIKYRTCSWPKVRCVVCSPCARVYTN